MGAKRHTAAAQKDPNDPRDFLDELERTAAASSSVPSSSAGSPGVFRIDTTAEEAQLGADGRQEALKRTRVFKKRWAKEIPERTAVPLLERLVRHELLEEKRPVAGMDYIQAMEQDPTPDFNQTKLERIRKDKIDDFKQRARTALGRSRRTGGALGGAMSRYGVGVRLEDVVKDVHAPSLVRV